MEQSNVIILLICLITSLILIQVLISYFLVRDKKIKLLYKQRRKNIDYFKVLKFTLIAFFITLISPISVGTFEWYYIFLPVSIVLFLVINGIYHLSLENGSKDWSHITDGDIKANEREETIKDILK